MNSIEKFKNREIKAKEIFYIKQINKTVAFDFIRKYHYLADAKFFCIEAFGLFLKETDELMGCATFSLPQGKQSLKGWFGLPESDKTIRELSRLCVLPTLNNTNATSYLLGNSCKALKKDGVVRAVITLADSSRHVGSIYQVCNFTYYGLSTIKNDFYWIDDNNKLHNSIRGKCKDIHGVWVQKSRKHRYAYIFDKTLKCLYEEQPYPDKNLRLLVPCCGGSGKLHDRRFDEWWTCPRCTGKFEKIIEDI